MNGTLLIGTPLINEATIRLSIFIAVFAIIVCWEFFAPRRVARFSRRNRWPANLGLALTNTLVVRLLTPTATVGIAVLAAEQQWGLLNNLTLPAGMELLLGIMLLDMLIYFQHRMFHVVPFFWKFHRMHHTDLDFDTTTALRFHPIEIALSVLIKTIVVLMLGPPVLAVLCFEILLNATAMFNHGNINLPMGIDRVLRLVLVTPDMHRVHHSVNPAETNSNYGFNLPWWDRLFNTYQAQPEAGHNDMRIGLSQFSDAKELEYLRMLVQPFQKPESDSEDDT